MHNGCLGSGVETTLGVNSYALHLPSLRPFLVALFFPLMWKSEARRCPHGALWSHGGCTPQLLLPRVCKLSSSRCHPFMAHFQPDRWPCRHLVSSILPNGETEDLHVQGLVQGFTAWIEQNLDCAPTCPASQSSGLQVLPLHLGCLSFPSQ